MRPASASWLTSPSTAEAVPPAFKIASTRLSTPPQFVSRSPGALCSLATPAGRTSETTTVTPLAASARAVELPMPIGFPQPVISATRDGWGILFFLSLPVLLVIPTKAGIHPLWMPLRRYDKEEVCRRNCLSGLYRPFSEPVFSAGAPADLAAPV